MDYLPRVCYVLTVFCVAATLGHDLDTFPANEYEYSVRRDHLQEYEAEMAGNHIVLSQDEQIVDRYLQFLKYKHFQETKRTGLPAMMPIERVLGEITQADVYRVLNGLPKGGNMHTHENHLLGKGEVLDMLWESPDFENLYILPENNSKAFTLDFFINPPSADWVRVQNNTYYTKERILPNLQLINILSDKAKANPWDSSGRWAEMDTLWGKCAGHVISNINIKKKHLMALYSAGLREGVQYQETRKRFRSSERIYELSTDPKYRSTNGKHYLDETGELELNITLQAVEEFKASNPSFIGHNRIAYSIRSYPISRVLSDIDNILYLHKKFPSHLKGFDLVSEEDVGYSHLFYLENFLKLYDNQTHQSKLNLYLHTAETSYPRDLIASDKEGDPTSTADNTYDALALGAKRVGHGLAYIKYPYLLRALKAQDVSIEICPVSNQLLGLTPDLRNHPANHYIKMGIPVVLGADDPGTFGVDSVTIDWYVAFMDWSLTLKDLKKLAQNSLEYSTMSRQEIDDAVDNKWRPSWDKYMLTLKNEACGANLKMNDPKFYRILPRDGAIVESTKVHVYGRNFERAVCNKVVCKFGQSESPSVIYVTNYHIICMTPSGPGAESTVRVKLSLNNGTSYYDTGLDFTYKHPVERKLPDKPSTGSSLASCPMSIGAVLLLLVILYQNM